MAVYCNIPYHFVLEVEIPILNSDIIVSSYFITNGCIRPTVFLVKVF